MRTVRKRDVKGLIFNIQGYSVQDGPGIRTTVFLKGCPLKCQWCSNAESQASFPELAFIRKLCTLCGRCVKACPEEAISIDGSDVRVERNLCTCCGKCIEVCHPTALKIWGEEISVGEALQEVEKDRPFYKNSGGGVTLSGGEPLNQPGFTLAFLQRCHEIGLDTCLDTCGFVDPHILEKALKYTDLVLYDLKHMDSVIHQRLTGVPNQLILDNAKLIADKGIPMIMRVPLVPGLNDSAENISSIAAFTRNLKSVHQIDLLPYHRFGISKYEALGHPYALSSLQSPGKEDVEKAKHIIVEQFNLQCNIGG